MNNTDNNSLRRQLGLFYVFRLLATSYLWVPILVKFKMVRGLSFYQVMILGAIYSGVVILMELPTGAFADRIGRRIAMAIGAACMTVSCLIAFSADSFNVFLIAEVFAAISMSLCSGADSAYLYDLMAANDKQQSYPKAEAIASAFHQAGSALAFAGGGILAYYSMSLPYLITAVVAAVACVIALFMTDEKDFSRDAAGSNTMRGCLRLQTSAIAAVLRSRPLRWIIVYSAVVFLLLRASEFLYQPHLESRGFVIWQVGLVFAGAYVIATLVSRMTPWLRRKFGENTLLWSMLLMLAVTYLVLEKVQGSWVLALLFVQALANGLYSPVVKPILNRNIENSEHRASVLSIESIGRRFSIVLFWPFAGLFGIDSAPVVCGIVGVTGALLLAVLWRPYPRDPRIGEGFKHAAGGTAADIPARPLE